MKQRKLHGSSKVYMFALIFAASLVSMAVSCNAEALEVYLTNYPEVIGQGEIFTCDVEVYNSGC